MLVSRGHPEQDPSACRAEIRGGFCSVLAVWTVPHIRQLTVKSLKAGYERVAKGLEHNRIPVRRSFRTLAVFSCKLKAVAE